MLLTNVWILDEKLTFIVSENENLKCSLNWVKRVPWLRYTNVQNIKVLYKYCTVFRYNFTSSHQKLEVFGTKPFNK